MDYRCICNAIRISLFEIFCNQILQDASLLLRSSSCAFFVERQLSGCSSWWCLTLCGGSLGVGVLSSSGQHGLPSSTGGRAGAMQGLQKATSERLDSVTHKAAPPALVPAQERDPALWHWQHWLLPFSVSFRTASVQVTLSNLPYPGLSSYFLPCVWVMREWRWGLTFDRGQAKTKDWLALKTPGNVYA